MAVAFFLVGVVGPILMELYQGEGDAANWWGIAWYMLLCLLLAVYTLVHVVLLWMVRGVVLRFYHFKQRNEELDCTTYNYGCRTASTLIDVMQLIYWVFGWCWYSIDSVHMLFIILQGSGLGLVALWPDLCFAQGATEEFPRMSFCCGCRLDQS